MKDKLFTTPCGTIRYWVSEEISDEKPTLVFLPGLTADHRLFEKQTEYFEPRCNVLVWDAPAHAESRPFSFDFRLTDKAEWLDGILEQEGIRRFVLVGQSMGGYVGQAYAKLHPEKLAGFVSVDSAPLGREYVTAGELWLLKRMEPVYRLYPWKTLVRAGSEGVATTEYGKNLMRGMMCVYENDRAYYAKLTGHGYRMLAEAMESGTDWTISCPALLICGTQDRAGSTMRYNRAWHKKTGIPLEWIDGAGHNANADRPEEVNRLIEHLLERAYAREA